MGSTPAMTGSYPLHQPTDVYIDILPTLSYILRVLLVVGVLID